MLPMRLLSWNVNGLRAIAKKGFLEWLYHDLPDVLCLQEVKAREEDVSSELRNPQGYRSYFHSPRDTRGQSGVAIFTRILPEKVENGFGVKKFDDEGRVQVAYFKNFVLVNAYFPNSGRPERIPFKLEFNDAILKFMEGLRKKGFGVLLCGDLNAAHEEIDLARPRENVDHAGFLPQERAWVDELVAAGYIDSFRHFYPNKHGAYSWWDPKSRARDRNIGWRIDYFFIAGNLIKHLLGASILDHVSGSDHCPVSIELSFARK